LIRTSATIVPDDLSAPDPRVVHACDFIREHLAEPLSVAEVARQCHVSPSRLAHLFKANLGLGLQQFRDNLRMQQAGKCSSTPACRLPP